MSDLADIGIETLSLVVDDPSSVAALYKEVERLTAGRGLDYLVNNAGRNYNVPCLDIDYDEVQNVFDINVFAVMRMCNTFAPLLIKAKGTIVQIGSVAGKIPYVWGSVYNASKAALKSYSDCLRIELRPFGVHVITVVTGGVKSNIARIERNLPEDSRYAMLRPQYERRQKHSQEVGMVTAEYAQYVVNKIMGARGYLWNQKSIWAGSNSTMIWWFGILFPEGVYDPLMSGMFGLRKLGQKVAAEEESGKKNA